MPKPHLPCASHLSRPLPPHASVEEPVSTLAMLHMSFSYIYCPEQYHREQACEGHASHQVPCRKVSRRHLWPAIWSTGMSGMRQLFRCFSAQLCLPVGLMSACLPGQAGPGAYEREALWSCASPPVPVPAPHQTHERTKPRATRDASAVQMMWSHKGTGGSRGEVCGIGFRWLHGSSSQELQVAVCASVAVASSAAAAAASISGSEISPS